jgi:hypothetical protein
MEIGYTGDATTGKRLEKALVRCHDALQKQVDKKKKEAAKPAKKAAKPATEAEKPATEAEKPASVGLLALIALVGPPPEKAPPPEKEPPADDLEFPLDDLQLPPEDPNIDVPGWGEVEAEAVSLPALTAWLAALDSVNPCAFFVLTILLSLMLRTGSRKRMLLVGGVFVFFSALVYFLFMAAWLNLFFLIGHLRWITVAAGILAVVVGLINIKDYFWFKAGVTLSLSESAKEKLFRRMNVLMKQAGVLPLLGGTAALAFAANLYELLCTSGLPMVYTRVLTMRQLSPAGYYGYLALYNLIYVAPLALIVLVFALTLSARKLTEYQGRVLKLLSGLMMLALGVLLIAAPNVLNSLIGAAGTVLGSIAITALIVVGERVLRRRRPPASPAAPPAAPPAGAEAPSQLVGASEPEAGDPRRPTGSASQRLGSHP